MHALFYLVFELFAIVFLLRYIVFPLIGCVIFVLAVLFAISLLSGT